MCETEVMNSRQKMRKVSFIALVISAPDLSPKNKLMTSFYLQIMFFLFVLLFVLFSICFEWACQDFQLLKANLGPLCMPHPGTGPLV